MHRVAHYNQNNTTQSKYQISLLRDFISPLWGLLLQGAGRSILHAHTLSHNTIIGIAKAILLVSTHWWYYTNNLLNGCKYFKRDFWHYHTTSLRSSNPQPSSNFWLIFFDFSIFKELTPFSIGLNCELAVKSLNQHLLCSYVSLRFN